MDAITEQVRDTVQARLIAINADVENVGQALDEVCVNYEVMAHLIAALGTWASPATQQTIIAYITRNLARYVAELAPVPDYLVPGSNARN